MSKVKQVVVLRKDLGMRKGKMVSQGAHASMKAIFDRGAISADDSNQFEIAMDDDMKEWMLGTFTKICVSVNSEEELLAIYTEGEAAGIPCALIQDVGLTEFGGVATHTAVAIGPANSSIVDKITGGLKLL